MEQARATTTTGGSNTAEGKDALANTTGATNTAIGSGAWQHRLQQQITLRLDTKLSTQILQVLIMLLVMKLDTILQQAETQY